MFIKCQHIDLLKEAPMFDVYLNPDLLCSVEPILDRRDPLRFWRVRTAGNDTYILTDVQAESIIQAKLVNLSDTRTAADAILTEKPRPLHAPSVAPLGYSPESLIDFVRMLNQEDYVLLDTETTGLEQGEICQIAIVSKDGNTLLNTVVKTHDPIPPSAFAIHGISDTMVENAPTWETVRDLVYDLLKGKHVVIYNAVYDRKMMHQSSERWNMPKTEWKDIATFWCAMTHFAEVYGDWNDYRSNYRWQKLELAARYYHIPQPEAHTAISDAKTTAALCAAMAQQSYPSAK